MSRPYASGRCGRKAGTKDIAWHQSSPTVLPALTT